MALAKFETLLWSEMDNIGWEMFGQLVFVDTNTHPPGHLPVTELEQLEAAALGSRKWHSTYFIRQLSATTGFGA